MKKLFMLMLVGICSQSFCMDSGSVQHNGGNTVNMNRERTEVVANQILAYFAHNDQDEPVADPRQALDRIMPEFRAALEFDLNHVGGRGWRNYRNSANLDRLLGAILGGQFVNAPLIDEGDTIADVIRSSRALDNHIAAINASIADMVVPKQRTAYLFFYSNMCNMFKVLNRLVENTQDGEVDNIQGRAVHRISELVRQMSDMVIRIGGYVQDQVQQQ